MKRTTLFICLLLAGFVLRAQLNPEQEKIRQTFFRFLAFYEKNEKRFNFNLYRGTGPDNAPPYRVNWKEAERYFAFLRREVPMVGEAYIKAERAHFKFSDSCFKTDPEEEMPVGFDYDRWAGGQESIEYTRPYYTSKDNIYQVTITGNKAVLRIGGPLGEGQTEKDRDWSFVPFVKEKGIWKMADNVYPEFDSDEQ
jgi:hypothetical protein